MKIRKLEIENYSVKRFIKKFNFPDPLWNKLPNGFPDISKDGLTKEECHLLDAIKLAWITTQSEGRKRLLFDTARATFLTFAILVIGVFVYQIFRSPQDSITTVSAAGVRVDDVIQSTMSAVLRK